MFHRVVCLESNTIRSNTEGASANEESHTDRGMSDLYTLAGHEASY